MLPCCLVTLLLLIVVTSSEAVVVSQYGAGHPRATHVDRMESSCGTILAEGAPVTAGQILPVLPKLEFYDFRG